MGIFKRIITVALILLTSVLEVSAQMNGTNLMEYQFGKIPVDTLSHSTLYDRAVVNYNYKLIKSSVSLEQFHSPVENRNYLKLTQYSIKYDSDPLQVKIGNFYETIGRGLLLRSYEIPGAILEDLSYRSRHYFNHDILGFSTNFRHKNFTTKLIYGQPLNYVFPPTQSERLRRPDIVEAIYSDYSFSKQTLGTSVLRLTNNGQKKVYSMITASGNLFSYLSYYTELAKNVSNYTIADFSKQAPYAFYGSINLAFDNLGLSAEYKNYNNFLIGTGINEPPALVKEHSFKVLNRSTHVLQPQNEKGYQFELFYTFQNLSTLTLNHTLAINNFGKKFNFQEYFVEYDFSIHDKHDVKIFTDYAEDPFRLENQRISAGAYFEWKVIESSTIKTEYEFQAFKRLGETVQNHALLLGYAYTSKLIFSILGEFSNDSFFAANKNKTWLGANFKYQINPENSFLIFAGQRRGGPACNAGICYEVLDFTGVEVRFTSRF